jgi:pentatricopeptide repeat protein
MKDRGYTTVDSRKMTKIFTLLANACYRASDSTMAIDRAIQFVDELKTKGMYVFIMINHHKLLLSDIIGFRIEYRTFNALIAAFGKHGQLKMAFQLADEMVEVGFIPNEDTYASLLIACNSEKNTGFKYAIEVKKQNHILRKLYCDFM